MTNLAWVLGPVPNEMDERTCESIRTLFLEETGERYSDASLRHLPVPSWKANLILVDIDEVAPRTIHGVFWSTPFKDDIVRVVAFVIRRCHQGQTWGAQAWSHFEKVAFEHGFRHIQLEVKADNTGAIKFYRRRGLIHQQDLVGYYQSGLGHMMRGPLQEP